MRLRCLPHYLYLADLVEGARVLEVGCGSGGGANFLANHGAARVVGIDEAVPAITESRARFSLTNLEFRRELYDSIELDDAHFDAVFVPNGVSALRRKAVLGELRRVLRPGGHLVLCVTSADRPRAVRGASFHECLERLSPLFDPVRMVAQSPFVGMSLVEYAGAAAPVPLSLDTSLQPQQSAREVTEYVAVCGGRPDAPPRGFTIVQLPSSDGFETIAASRSAGRTEFETDIELTAPATPSAIDQLDEELDAVRFERDHLAATVETVTLERQRAESEIASLREQLDERRQQEPPPSELIAAAVEAHREHTESLEGRIREQDAYIEELREAVVDAERRAEQAAAEREAAEGRARMVTDALAQWRDRASVAEGRLLAYESGDSPVESAVAGAADTLISVKHQLERTEREHGALAVGDVAERLLSLETALEAERSLLAQIEDGLSAMRRQAAEEDDSPSAWAAQREEQLRDLAGELGMKDAEIAILHVGITSLRDRVKRVLHELRDARRSIDGQSAPEVAGVLDRLADKLAAYEEQE